MPPACSPALSPPASPPRSRSPAGSPAPSSRCVVADRTGRPAPEVLALLDHPAPADDAALVRLADDLDALERQVRHP